MRIFLCAKWSSAKIFFPTLGCYSNILWPNFVVLITGFLQKWSLFFSALRMSGMCSCLFVSTLLFFSHFSIKLWFYFWLLDSVKFLQGLRPEPKFELSATCKPISFHKAEDLIFLGWLRPGQSDSYYIKQYEMKEISLILEIPNDIICFDYNNKTKRKSEFKYWSFLYTHIKQFCY